MPLDAADQVETMRMVERAVANEDVGVALDGALVSSPVLCRVTERNMIG